MESFTQKIKIGSRASKLALVQVEEVRSLLKEKGIKISFARRTYSTRGDQNKTVSLTASPADDFFTDALDTALLNNEIDAAIHSAKDLPQPLPAGVRIFFLPPSPPRNPKSGGEETT